MILMLCYRNKKLILIPSEQVNVMNLNYRTLFVTTMIMSIVYTYLVPALLI